MRMESGFLAEKIKSQEALEAEAEKDVIEKEKYLSSLCAERGNPIIIVESGKQLTSGLKIREELATIEDADLKETLELMVPGLNEFVSSPVFTDSFHENHTKRRQWERENSDLLSPDAWRYYESNRLGFNKLMQAANAIGTLADPYYNHALPSDIAAGIGQLYLKLKETFQTFPQEYGKADDESKLALVTKMTDISRELLSLLTEKS